MTARARSGRGGAAFDVGGVPVVVRRRRGLRRISLSVSRLDGRAVATAPLGVGDAEIRRFLDRHRDWLATTVGKQLRPIHLGVGTAFPFRGETWRVAAAAEPGVREDPAARTLFVGGPRATAPARLGAFLREAARARLAERSQVHAAALGVRFEKLSIRDTRSRWGSCSSAGALSYSWRLILAPDAALNYVAAHEVAHLRELNHSTRFWALVDVLDPTWRRWRDWLRTNGAELHRYRLSPPPRAVPSAAA